MWRRLQEHCRDLAGGPAPEWAALDDEAFLTAACRQAVLDWAESEATLAICHDLLAQAPPGGPSEDRQAEIRRHLAIAGLATLVCRAGEGEVPRSAFTAWLSRLFGAPAEESGKGNDKLVTGWDCLEACCESFHHATKKDRNRARHDVTRLVKDTAYGAIRPAGEEESRLIELLRALPVFPPFRFDQMPPDGSVPDDFRSTSRFRGQVKDLPTEHIDEAAALLGCACPRVRVAAALLMEQMVPEEGFGENNPRAGRLRRALREYTNDAHAAIRRVSLGRLGILFRGQPPPAVVADLAAHLHDPSLAARVAAATSLTQFGTAADTPATLAGLLVMLQEYDESALAAALDLATVVGPSLADAHIDRAHELLNHPAATVARRAASAIGSAGELAARPAIVETLLDLFRDADGEVREAAVLAYGRLGVVPHERALAELGRVLHEDKEIKGAVLETIQRVGGGAASHAILTGLAACLRADGVWAARRALEAMGPAAVRDDVFAALSDLLVSATSETAREVFDLGCRLGPAATARMLNLLAEKLADEQPRVRRLALSVVGGVKSQAATTGFIDRVARLLRHPAAGVRAAAAEAVEFLGPDAATSDVLRLLTDLKVDADRDVRFRAEDALYRLTGKR